MTLLTLPQFMPQFLHLCKASGDFCLLFKALDFNDYTIPTESQLPLFLKGSPVRESLQLFGIPPNTSFFFFFLLLLFLLPELKQLKLTQVEEHGLIRTAGTFCLLSYLLQPVQAPVHEHKGLSNR